MEAKDIMIGDLVKTNTNWPKKLREIICRITNVGDNYIASTAINNPEINPYGNSVSFCPIPLTEEILRKNGWEYNGKDAKFFPETWVGGGLKLQNADDGGYCIVVTSDYDDEDTNSTPFILHYVHELQHTLRLCGIEKEIEL